MEQDEVADLSEQCRLCLETETSNVPTYSLDANCGSIVDKTVHEVIKYCLDIDVKSMFGGEFLPQQICEICLMKLEESYAFKQKSQQVNETLKGIIDALGIDSNEDHDESLLQEVDIPPNLENDEPFSVEERSEGRGSKLFTCKVCSKTFRYAKPFMNHMMLHNPMHKSKNGSEISELRGTKAMTCSICLKEFKYLKTYVNHMTSHNAEPSLEDATDVYQPSQYTYSEKKGRGRPKKERFFNESCIDDPSVDYKPPRHVLTSDSAEKKRPGRPRKDQSLIDSNQSFHDALLSANYNDDYLTPALSYDEPMSSLSSTAGAGNLDKKARGRPKKLKNKYDSIPMTSIAGPAHTKKYGPHNPHWKQKAAMAKKEAAATVKQEKSDHEDAGDDEVQESDVMLPGFVEVDLMKVLNKKVEDSPVKKKIKRERTPPRSRSRSPSIELIPEEDILAI